MKSALEVHLLLLLGTEAPSGSEKRIHQKEHQKFKNEKEMEKTNLSFNTIAENSRFEGKC